MSCDESLQWVLVLSSRLALRTASVYFFISKNIKRKQCLEGSTDLTDKYNLFVLAEAVSTSVDT